MHYWSTCLIALALGASAPAKAATGEEFDAVSMRYQETLDGLDIPDFQLSFVANMRALGARDALKTQIERLEPLLTEVDRVSDVKDACRRRDAATMRRRLSLELDRARIGVRFASETVNLEAVTTLSDLPLSSDWYRHYLRRWTGADVDPDAIFAMGERELAKAVQSYDTLQAELGFAGDDEGLATHLAQNAPRSDGDAETLARFRRKQAIIWDNLGALFPRTHGVSPAAIERSPRGASFPVPGYYNPDKKTFYYNVLEETYDDRQADWLLIHEGTPGHHFQIHASRNADPCPNALPGAFNAAYVEGWAAYAETLGDALGLYQTPEEKLAAVEWDMVRSARVAIDVGLNAYGWSDEKALAYWRANVRGQYDIAQREIDRMRRWPAQVVSYKYGAVQIASLRRRYVDGDDATLTLPEFLDVMASSPPMDWAAFETLFPDFVEQAKNERAHAETRTR